MKSDGFCVALGFRSSRASLVFSRIWHWRIDSFCLVFLGFEANGDRADQGLQVAAFKEYGLIELRKATNGFSTDHIVSESGEKAPNVVYKGNLENNHFVAVKRFSKQSWPDAQQLVVRTRGVLFMFDRW